MSKINWKLFFDTNEAPNFWLSNFRIGVGLTVVLKIIFEFPYINMLYGTQGIVQSEIAAPLQSKYTIHLSNLFLYFKDIISEQSFLHIFYTIYFFFGLALILGMLTRISIFFCWVFHVLLFNNTNLVLYGFDSFLLTLLFYAMLFPVGKVFSVDNVLFRQKTSISETTNFYHKVLQFHLCVVYLVAGTSKLRGTSWLSGDAMWHAINQPQFFTFTTNFTKNLLACYPTVSIVLCYLVLTLEILFPLMIWVKRVNKIWLIGTIVMHLFIALMIGLWMFSTIMIVFNMAAFGHLVLYKNADNNALNVHAAQAQPANPTHGGTA